jgi:hypothetical protein
MPYLGTAPYRGVTVRKGGPVTSIERGRLTVLSRTFHQVNVHLGNALVPKGSWDVYSPAAGTGVHPARSIALQLGISEALARWAYHEKVSSADAARYGFDQDPTSAGLAVMPGKDDGRARRAAWWSAVKRFSLSAWWEGRAEARWLETDWPELQALVIDNPFGGVTVIAISGPARGGWAYGSAAGENQGIAFDKATIELARNRAALALGAGSQGRCEKQVSGWVERRLVFFASNAGYALVRARVEASAGARMPRPELACDCEVSGSWTRYATVWRTVFVPPSQRFLDKREDYFCF